MPDIANLPESTTKQTEDGFSIAQQQPELIATASELFKASKSLEGEERRLLSEALRLSARKTPRLKTP